jgi:hypothetical protein
MGTEQDVLDPGLSDHDRLLLVASLVVEIKRTVCKFPKLYAAKWVEHLVKWSAAIIAGTALIYATQALLRICFEVLPAIASSAW